MGFSNVNHPATQFRKAPYHELRMSQVGLGPRGAGPAAAQQRRGVPLRGHRRAAGRAPDATGAGGTQGPLGFFPWENRWKPVETDGKITDLLWENHGI